MHDRALGSARDNCAIRLLETKDAARWDTFVRVSPNATFFHWSAWRQLIEETLGHTCHYLYAEQNGNLVGILPLAEINSRLFGHALISTPFCVYGGIIAINESIAEQLRLEAVRLAQSLKVDYLEIRNQHAEPIAWPTKNLYVTFRKELLPEHTTNFQAIPRKQRAMVRKGMETGLRAKHSADLDAFYSIYAASVRNLGTPVMAKSYYARIKELFGDDCEITLIEHQSRPVSAVMSFYFKDEVHPYYGGSLRVGRELKANDFMYWSVMQRAVDRGAKIFDFGRSKIDTGSYHFKKHWGFEPSPLHYSYKLVRLSAIPNISPTNKKYRLFIKAWQHLPLPVSRVLGPWIARDLG